MRPVIKRVWIDNKSVLAQTKNWTLFLNSSDDWFWILQSIWTIVWNRCSCDLRFKVFFCSTFVVKCSTFEVEHGRFPSLFGSPIGFKMYTYTNMQDFRKWRKTLKKGSKSQKPIKCSTFGGTCSTFLRAKVEH